VTVAGIPLRPFSTSDIPPKLALNRAYFDALEAAGAEVVPIPILRDPSRLRFHYELLDALVLPGGADVEPRRYGAVARADCGLYVMPEVDEAELTLLRWAIADGMPVLAICRGIQVLNVACGGTLWQDLHVEGATRMAHDRGPRDALVHAIAVEPKSVLAQALGETQVLVNSLHHQAIRDLGAGLRAVATADDGLIEGVELSDHRFVVGIQCHPEELAGQHEWASRLFKALVSAGAEYRESRSTTEPVRLRPARRG
jgi:putative glutamine amidotransferase